MIATGLLIWCHKKNKHGRSPRVDPEQPEPNPGQREPNPGQREPNPGQREPNPGQREPNSEAKRPTISGPINNLNSAYEEADLDSSEDESIYNEPMDDPYQKNPFQGWAFSSFRPVGPPPPPPSQAIPMVVRPVAKTDRSTMTDCPKLKGALPKAATKARSDIQSGYIASPDSSLERSACRMAGGPRAKQQQDNSLKTSRRPVDQGHECPTYNLPPLPVRSSSLRHKKKGEKNKCPATSATMY